MPGIGTVGRHEEQRTDREIGTLFPSETWWRDRYHELENHGYTLRPRYHPDWEPSWKQSGKRFFSTEDGQPALLPTAMYATRWRDGRQVMLKKVPVGEELEIGRLLSFTALRQEPSNRCVPLLEIFELPNAIDQKLIVMSFLRSFNNPRFQTFGEFVAFFTQICEGLRFMHERNIAHREQHHVRSFWNVPYGFHPIQINRNKDFKGRAKSFTRTQQPTRYYLIDFGLSRQYTSRDALDEPLRGGDKSVPEHREGRRCNPFHTDIYYLGNLIPDVVFQLYNGFEFIVGLVNAMTDEDPAKRPMIEDVILIFPRIRDSLSRFKLRSLITPKKGLSLVNTFRYIPHAIRTAQYIILQKAAIPHA
ncbi:hypothetical protein BC827DRAFT_1379648 [Russula dissimulans]|nr:hypothetical protein BC827DRAFT_1379648 [Russula dissimulans]